MSTQMETCSHGVYKRVRCEACIGGPGHDIHERPTINEIVDAYVEPSINPHADDVCGTNCPFELEEGHRIKDHPRFSTEPRQPIECTCGHDGKLTSKDCPLHGEPRQPAEAPELLRLKQAAMMLADGYESYRSEFQALATPERILSILNCRADSPTVEAERIAQAVMEAKPREKLVEVIAAALKK